MTRDCVEHHQLMLQAGVTTVLLGLQRCLLACANPALLPAGGATPSDVCCESLTSLKQLETKPPLPLAPPPALQLLCQPPPFHSFCTSAGGATPTAAFFESLTALKQLQVLEVLPGVYGQIAGYDMDREQGNAGVRQYALAMS